MEQTSKHYGDQINWIIKVINSCKTTDQLWNASKLSNYFLKNYLKWDDRKLHRILSTDLDIAFRNKLKELSQDEF
jgi:hypothetical protein